jgi:hypothetical protein
LLLPDRQDYHSRYRRSDHPDIRPYGAVGVTDGIAEHETVLVPEGHANSSPFSRRPSVSQSLGGTLFRLSDFSLVEKNLKSRTRGVNE